MHLKVLLSNIFVCLCTTEAMNYCEDKIAFHDLSYFRFETNFVKINAGNLDVIGRFYPK